MSKTIQITELDFDDIKSNIIQHMSSNPEFKDYNFNASGLNTIIDILATNTHMNAYYMNMISNEMFLDTARIRDNVVSKAKMLNYIPRSKKASEMSVDLTFNGVTPKKTAGVEESFTITKDFVFTTKKSGKEYLFRPKQTTIVPKVATQKNSDGSYTNLFSVKDIALIQGSYVTENYSVNTYDPNDRYLLTNNNIDISTITVFVYDNLNTTIKTEYKLATDNMRLSDISKNFFIQEGRGGSYEIFFGDGVLGSSITSGQYVEINYLVTSGKDANEISNVTLLTGNDNFTTTSVVVTSAAQGGTVAESVDSIKFNAPRTFEGQGRAVTSSDYRTIIPSIYPATQSINVWGGEDNIPPKYGHVYISIRPDDGLYVSEYNKSEIITKLKKDYSILTIIPEVVDAEYTKIKINTTVKFDDESTSLVADDIKSIVKTGILAFSKKFLDDFKDYFRYSNFVNYIDTLDDSITNNVSYVSLSIDKDVTLNTATPYDFYFNNPIEKGSIKSTGIQAVGTTQIWYVEEDSTYNGKLKLYGFDASNNNVKIYSDIYKGKVNYETGLINIEAITITDVEGTNEEFSIEVKPENLDVFPKRNQVLLIEEGGISITMEADNDNFNNNYDITNQNVKTLRIT
jgi:hypothetical protein